MPKKKLPEKIGPYNSYYNAFLGAIFGFFFWGPRAGGTPKRAILGGFGGPLKNASFVKWAIFWVPGGKIVKFFLYFAAKK